LSGGRRDLVDTSIAAGDLGKLADALSAAGLVAELRGPGPYTLFAPTDGAFGKLPPGELEALMADKPRLSAILHHHLLRGRLLTTDLPHGNVRTLEGSSVQIGATDEGPTVGRANITRCNILSSNGVIHAIDTVMMPGPAPAKPDEPESPWSGRRRMPPTFRGR
jgi:uncharacterized surface protein with fasciclin (FAS1) repeats